MITKDRTSTLDYLSEVDILSRLPPHPNIVRYIGSSHLRHPQGNVEFAILTDDCGSIRLDSMLNENQLTETNLKVKCFEEICLAVKHCHDNGIAHLKILPANILRDAFGTFKLSNFSFALAVSNSNSGQYPPYLSHFHDNESSYHGSARSSFGSKQSRISVTNTVDNFDRHDIYEIGNDNNNNVFDKKNNDSKENNNNNNKEKDGSKNNKENNNDNKNNKNSKKNNDKNKSNKNQNKNNKNKNSKDKDTDKEKNIDKDKDKDKNKKKQKNGNNGIAAKAKIIASIGNRKSNNNINVAYMTEESKENSSVFQNAPPSGQSIPLSNIHSNNSTIHGMSGGSTNDKLDSEIWTAPELLDPKLVTPMLQNRELFFAADVWSLGVLLTYLLYTKLPYFVTRTSGITEAVLPIAISSATSNFIQKKMMHADNRRRIAIDRVVTFITDIAKDPLLLASSTDLTHRHGSEVNSLNTTMHGHIGSEENALQLTPLNTSDGNNSVSGARGGNKSMRKLESTMLKLESKNDTSHFHVIDDLTNKILQCDLIFQNRYFTRLMLNFWKYPMNAMKMSSLKTLSNFESEIFERVYTVANYLSQRNSITAMKLLVLLHRLHLQTPKQFCIASIANMQFYETILITWQQDTSGDSFAPLLIPYSQYIVRRMQFHQEVK